MTPPNALAHSNALADDSTLAPVPASGPNAVLSPLDPAAPLFRGPQLGIVRKLEMMNLLVGFEQANQYAILNHLGHQVGYIVEEDSFASSLMRNFLHTHRRMNAMVLNAQGEPILHIHRPFNWINSTITISTPDGREIGAVEQEWHLWRRRYNLFNAREQFARIDAPFLAWEFAMCDEQGVPVGIVDRNFTGLGRELFTDTGHYAVHFVPPADARAKAAHAGIPVEELKLDERAVALAAAVTIDFDFFSRDRRGIMPAGIWLPGIWSSED
ncbi:phospholipid scramblase 1 [Catenaria anguillulae PL171]|uniref:Phospholipid scramblase n=1 Tax=Catenaria anguillulae PL171 TaxID=765915 RepID=A0A1Y2HL11_9FUNG|nr:phospholipid scramblase 1 [Catenaria anguillulae PL171]